MSTDLVTCEETASLRTVAERMFNERVGSVIVYNDVDDAVGIVTETDLIRASYHTGHPLPDIDVATAMSHPLVTISADKTLRRATERMAEEGVKKLPVADGLSLNGIITLTDIIHHFTDLKQEIHELERRSFEEHNR